MVDVEERERERDAERTETGGDEDGIQIKNLNQLPLSNFYEAYGTGGIFGGRTSRVQTHVSLPRMFDETRAYAEGAMGTKLPPYSAPTTGEGREPAGKRR